MKVKEIMTRDTKTCELNASLTEAARLMWDGDCGILPVLKDGKELVGVITDRDICMAMSMRDANAAAVSTEEVITGDVYSVAPDDDVQKALQTMAKHQVRRLPVVSADGDLKGLLSMNDIVLKAEEPKGRKAPEIAYADVVNTYKAICAHRVPQQAQSASAGE